MIDVPGEPFAKQRPRAAKKGRYITIYTPRETKQYEEKVRKVYNSTYENYQLEGDLTAKIEGFFSIPNSISKKKKIRQGLEKGSRDTAEISSLIERMEALK